MRFGLVLTIFLRVNAAILGLSGDCKTLCTITVPSQYLERELEIDQYATADASFAAGERRWIRPFCHSKYYSEGSSTCSSGINDDWPREVTYDKLAGPFEFCATFSDCRNCNLICTRSVYMRDSLPLRIKPLTRTSFVSPRRFILYWEGTGQCDYIKLELKKKFNTRTEYALIRDYGTHDNNGYAEVQLVPNYGSNYVFQMSCTTNTVTAFTAPFALTISPAYTSAPTPRPVKLQIISDLPYRIIVPPKGVFSTIIRFDWIGGNDDTVVSIFWKPEGGGSSWGLGSITKGCATNPDGPKVCMGLRNDQQSYVWSAVGSDDHTIHGNGFFYICDETISILPDDCSRTERVYAWKSKNDGLTQKYSTRSNPLLGIAQLTDRIEQSWISSVADQNFVIELCFQNKRNSFLTVDVGKESSTSFLLWTFNTELMKTLKDTVTEYIGVRDWFLWVHEDCACPETCFNCSPLPWGYTTKKFAIYQPLRLNKFFDRINVYNGQNFSFGFDCGGRVADRVYVQIKPKDADVSEYKLLTTKTFKCTEEKASVLFQKGCDVSDNCKGCTHINNQPLSDGEVCTPFDGNGYCNKNAAVCYNRDFDLGEKRLRITVSSSSVTSAGARSIERTINFKNVGIILPNNQYSLKVLEYNYYSFTAKKSSRYVLTMTILDKTHTAMLLANVGKTLPTQEKNSYKTRSSHGTVTLILERGDMSTQKDETFKITIGVLNTGSFPLQYSLSNEEMTTSPTKGPTTPAPTKEPTDSPTQSKRPTSSPTPPTKSPSKAPTKAPTIDPFGSFSKSYLKIEGKTLTESWSGGVLASNGYIYGIPYDALSILRIDPMTNSTRMIKFRSRTDTQYWSSGALGVDGVIYCMPHRKHQILKITPGGKDFTSYLELPASFESYTFMWSGAVAATNGLIYGIPAKSPKIIVIEPSTQQVTSLSFETEGQSSVRWRGGVLAPNKKIYGIPGEQTDYVLVIDPINASAFTIPVSTANEVSGRGGWWGAVLASDGRIFALPVQSHPVLIIDTNNDTMSTMELKLDDDTPGWNSMGMVAMSNGVIVGLPMEADSVLLIDPASAKTDTAKLRLRQPLPRARCISGGCGPANNFIRCSGSSRTVCNLNNGMCETKYNPEFGLFNDCSATCNDKVQNGDETRVDFGGSCGHGNYVTNVLGGPRGDGIIWMNSGTCEEPFRLTKDECEDYSDVIDRIFRDLTNSPQSVDWSGPRGCYYRQSEFTKNFNYKGCPDNGSECPTTQCTRDHICICRRGYQYADKMWSGVVGLDGRVYGIPSRRPEHVLVIDGPTTDNSSTWSPLPQFQDYTPPSTTTTPSTTSTRTGVTDMTDMTDMTDATDDKTNPTKDKKEASKASQRAQGTVGSTMIWAGLTAVLGFVLPW